MVQRLPVAKNSNKAVFPCTLSGWILIMPTCLIKLFMVKSVLKYGFVKVKF